jgi:hypothetical protein
MDAVRPAAKDATHAAKDLHAETQPVRRRSRGRMFT